MPKLPPLPVMPSSQPVDDVEPAKKAAIPPQFLKGKSKSAKAGKDKKKAAKPPATNPIADRKAKQRADALVTVKDPNTYKGNF